MARRKTTRGDGAGSIPGEELDALYALPLEAFTQAKNALAKRLREAGNEEGSEAVKALPKPSLSMWVVNQLARAHADDIRALVESGDRLREAQRRALQGEGAEALREGTRSQRGLVLVLAEDAAEVLRQAGKDASPPTLEQIQGTLTAAANGTPEDRALLEKGRLAKPLERVSFGGLIDVRMAAPPKGKAPERERPGVEAGAKAAEHQRAAAKAEEQERREAEARAKAEEQERREAEARAAKESERQRAETRRREQEEVRRGEAASRAERESRRREAQRLLRSASAAQKQAQRLEVAASKAEAAAAKARARADEARANAAALRDAATAAAGRAGGHAPRSV